MRLTTPPAERWRELLVQAGFEIERCASWFDGRQWQEGDSDSIWVARRPV
jgi:hypothetical protein